MITTIYLLLIILAIIFIWEGIKAYQGSNKATFFFLLDGKLELPIFIGTMLAANFSLGNMIFVCAIWGYFYGWSGAFWVAVCIIFLTASFILIGPNFKVYIEDKSNSGTIHEFISKRFEINDSSPEKKTKQKN